LKGKWSLGLSILFISLIVGILFRMSPATILKNIFLASIHPSTLQLIALIILVIFLGNLMKERGNLENIVSSLEAIIRNRRLGSIIPPALMGLLPMPAGALFSAPMVEEFGRKMGVSSENKTLLNYWFRHIWEYMWPLYPGLILAAALLNVKVRDIILAQYPLTLAAVAAGFLFCMKKGSYPPSSGFFKPQKKTKFVKEIRVLIFNTWPILAIIFLVLIFKVELLLAILTIVLIVLVSSRMKGHKIFLSFKKSLSLSMLLLIISVMVFKRVFEVSGAFSVIPTIFSHWGVSPLIILFFAPFLAGLLTGITSAFVGIAFPLLLPLMIRSQPNLTYAMLAYAGGFAGVLLSPFHLCLIVTREYFEADLRKLYKLLFLPVTFVVMVALLIVGLKGF
jgi:integral membrane protein (TIGR00529 family)